MMQPSFSPFDMPYVQPEASQMIATSVRPVLAHTTSMKSWEPQLAATTWFRHVSTESRGPMGPLESTGLSLAYHHFTCEHGHFGGKLAVSRCGKIIWKVLRRCKEYPLCATAISLKYTELYRIIFCVDDKSIDYLIIQFWTASGKPHSCHAFALCMVKDCAEAVDARPNPDMKTQSVYSFGRPSARSRMADASGSVRWSSYVMAQSCSLY